MSAVNPHLPRLHLLLACCLALAGCGGQPAAEPTGEIQPVASPEEGGAVSRAPLAEPPPAVAPVAPAPPPARVPDWSAVELTSGEAWVDCGLDYRHGDGEPLTTPSRMNLRHLLEPCRDGDVVRLRYRGKIAADFTVLVLPWLMEPAKWGEPKPRHHELTLRVLSELGIRHYAFLGTLERALAAGMEIHETGVDPQHPSLEFARAMTTDLLAQGFQP